MLRGWQADRRAEVWHAKRSALRLVLLDGRHRCRDKWAALMLWQALTSPAALAFSVAAMLPVRIILRGPSGYNVSMGRAAEQS